MNDPFQDQLRLADLMRQKPLHTVSLDEHWYSELSI
jgi:hypothetical protein